MHFIQMLFSVTQIKKLLREFTFFSSSVCVILTAHCNLDQAHFMCLRVIRGSGGYHIGQCRSEQSKPSS